LIPWQPEEPGLWVSWLRQWRHGADFDVAKTECVQRLYKNSVFIETRSHTEPVLKLESQCADVMASLAGSDQAQTTQQPQPSYH
jgi:hypothetical protein